MNPCLRHGIGEETAAATPEIRNIDTTKAWLLLMVRMRHAEFSARLKKTQKNPKNRRAKRSHFYMLDFVVAAAAAAPLPRHNRSAAAPHLCNHTLN